MGNILSGPAKVSKIPRCSAKSREAPLCSRDTLERLPKSPTRPNTTPYNRISNNSASPSQQVKLMHVHEYEWPYLSMSFGDSRDLSRAPEISRKLPRAAESF